MGKAYCSRPLHLGSTMPIRSYLYDHSAFEPEAIEAMSKALEETCKALHINGRIQDREAIAERIISLVARFSQFERILIL